MIRVERTTAADRATVWELLSRLSEWDQLLPTVDQVAQVGPTGPVRVGTAFRLKQPGLAAADYIVTDWRPEAGFTWESTAPGLRTIATHTVQATGDRTRLRLGLAWSGPLARPVRLLLGRKARRYVEVEAETFARLAERAPR